VIGTDRKPGKRSDCGVVILTKDEAAVLPRCLAAIPKEFEVFVVDSGSTDATVAIAQCHGCQVLVRDWTGFADQRNFALETLTGFFKWIVFIDADESFPEPIWSWINETLDDQLDADVVYLSQRIHIGDKMLKYAPYYPIYHPRIVKCRSDIFLKNQSGHGETIKNDLQKIYIDVPYHHYIIAENCEDWLLKHVRLAIIEAQAASSVIDGVVTNRSRLNTLMQPGPLRAVARFVFHFIVGGGWRDGRAGFYYSALYGWFELTKWLASIRMQ
jgi:glycosyltransferase involved in cell wall biosynthesis